MPFVSKSQRRACYAQQALDSKSTWNCAEFEAATPKDATLPEKKAMLSTLALIDLYNKPESEWDDTDKALQREFSTSIREFDAAHKTAALLTEDVVRAAARRHPDYEKLMQASRDRKGWSPEEADAAALEMAGHFKEASKSWPQKLRDLLERRGELPGQKEALLETVDGFHSGLKGVLKQASVDEMIRTTSHDAAPTGTEVHPPLMSNPYMGRDPAGAQDYENGYQHAQSIGHMQLSLAPADQWAKWQMNGPAWFGGFSAGASSVGSQPPVAPKVAHMITVAEILKTKLAMHPLAAWAPAIGAGLGAGAGLLGRKEDETALGAMAGGAINGGLAGLGVRFLAQPFPTGPQTGGPAPTSPPPVQGPETLQSATARAWMLDQINNKVSHMLTAVEVLETKFAAHPLAAWAPAIGAGVGAGAGLLLRDDETPAWKAMLKGGLGGAAAGFATRVLTEPSAPRPSMGDLDIEPAGPARRTDPQPTDWAGPEALIPRPTSGPGRYTTNNPNESKVSHMLTAVEVLALKEAAFPATAKFMYDKTAPARAAGQPGTVGAAAKTLSQPLAKPPAGSPAWSSPANMERLLGGKKSAAEILASK